MVGVNIPGHFMIKPAVEGLEVGAPGVARGAHDSLGT